MWHTGEHVVDTAKGKPLRYAAAKKITVPDGPPERIELFTVLLRITSFP